MIDNKKLEIRITKEFSKNLKKIKRQGKDLKKLQRIIDDLANNVPLDKKYKNHKLKDNKYFQNCYECHIESDWLLVYQILNDKLILLLVNTGNHSELF